MSHFKTYLKEEVDVKKIHEDLVNLCLPWLHKFWTRRNRLPKMLYRGSNKNIKTGTIAQTRPDRNPSDTNVQIHDSIGKAMKEKFGINYRAENILFAFTEVREAQVYGDIYMVFPIGDKVSWLSSDTIRDPMGVFDVTNISYFILKKASAGDDLYRQKLRDYFREKYGKQARKVFDAFADGEKYDAVRDIFDWDTEFSDKVAVDFLETLGYGENEFNYGGVRELMIHCKEYYVVDSDDVSPGHMTQIVMDVLRENPARS